MFKSNSLPMALTVLGLSAAASFAEVKLGENLSMSGFLDMSTYGSANDDDATLSASFDQLEIDFMLKYGNFSGRADINALPSSTNPSVPPGGSVFLEQGYVSALLVEGLSVSMGKFLSSSGFEAAEPTGLYQYSVSKLLSGYAGPTYGGYQNGLNLAYAMPKFALYGSVVTSVWGSDLDYKTPGFEAQVAVMPVEGVTAKATFLHEIYDDTSAFHHDSQSEANVWAMYAKGAITVAAEYSHLFNWGATEQTGMGYLAMANFKATDKLAFTLRYSGIKLEDADDPDSEVTFSPSFAIAGNWLVLAEVRRNIDAETTDYGAESTFSF